VTPFEATFEMSIASISKMDQTANFDDVSLSDTDSDGSYDHGDCTGPNAPNGKDTSKTQESKSEEPKFANASEYIKTNFSKIMDAPLPSFFRNLKSGESSISQATLEDPHGSWRQKGKWPQDASVATGDSDVESVVSNNSGLNSEFEKDTPKLDPSSLKSTDEGDQLNPDFEDITADAEIQNSASQLQSHSEQILQILNDIPIPGDVDTHKVISQQIQTHSRSIAAMFGDNIT
jgi:hypothetical protein